MGYNITSVAFNAKLHKKHTKEILKAFSELNQLNMLKSGGGYENSVITGTYGKQEAWFSFMSEWQPKHIGFFTEPSFLDVVDTFQKLGFETSLSEDGEMLNLVGYDSKKGQEQLFFAAIFQWLYKDFSLEFEGEDGEYFSYDYKDIEHIYNKLSRFIVLNQKYQNIMFDNFKKEAITKEELKELKELHSYLLYI